MRGIENDTPVDTNKSMTSHSSSLKILKQANKCFEKGGHTTSTNQRPSTRTSSNTDHQLQYCQENTSKVECILVVKINTEFMASHQNVRSK